MSFPYNQKRKEKNAQNSPRTTNILNKKLFLLRGKTSFSASLERIRGSITIELSLLLPLLLCAVLSLLACLEIINTKVNIRAGLQGTGKIVAEEMALEHSFSTTRVKRLLVESVGEERIRKSKIKGGISGISCRKSFYEEETGEIHLCATYQVKFPIPFIYPGNVSLEERCMCRAWTGDLPLLEENSKWVYITETGTVYHTCKDCTHLCRHIQKVKKEQVEEMRNASGGKYYPCSCTKNMSKDTCYITVNGNRYHGSLSCHALKRTIKRVSLSQVQGRRMCSKCKEKSGY